MCYGSVVFLQHPIPLNTTPGYVIVANIHTKINIDMNDYYHSLTLETQYLLDEYTHSLQGGDVRYSEWLLQQLDVHNSSECASCANYYLNTAVMIGIDI